MKPTESCDSMSTKKQSPLAPSNFMSLRNSSLELPQADFLSVIRNAPLISIDLIIKNLRDEILLGLRRNQPARGFWFVPGGRIHKGQSIETAFTSIANREIGISANISDAAFLGVYEHFYDTNFFEHNGFGTHFVTLGYQIMLDDIDTQRLPNDQHDFWKWFALGDLKMNPDVHQNTKRYFYANSLMDPKKK